METFWNTISAYNAATWPLQIALAALGALLTLLLCVRPLKAVRTGMKLYMALLNFWIAGVYYMIYCRPREYHDMLALFWAIMGCIWLYDLAAGHASLERTGRHSRFALLLFLMPAVYPLASLALGRTFPAITSPVMPCSVAVFTIGLMLAFSQRVNIGIPEDYLLACSVVPAPYVFFREYVRQIAAAPSKPSPRVLNALLAVLCLLVGTFFTLTLLHQFDLFAGL